MNYFYSTDCLAAFWQKLVHHKATDASLLTISSQNPVLLAVEKHMQYIISRLVQPKAINHN